MSLPPPSNTATTHQQHHFIEGYEMPVQQSQDCGTYIHVITGPDPRSTEHARELPPTPNPDPNPNPTPTPAAVSRPLVDPTESCGGSAMPMEQHQYEIIPSTYEVPPYAQEPSHTYQTLSNTSNQAQSSL